MAHCLEGPLGDVVPFVGAPAAPVDQRERQAAEDAGLPAAVATRWALGPGVRVQMLEPRALLREGCFCQGHAQRAGYLGWARLQDGRPVSGPPDIDCMEACLALQAIS